MRTTVFRLDDGFVPEVEKTPSWEPFQEYEGKPLKEVSSSDSAHI